MCDSVIEYLCPAVIHWHGNINNYKQAPFQFWWIVSNQLLPRSKSLFYWHISVRLGNLPRVLRGISSTRSSDSTSVTIQTASAIHQAGSLTYGRNYRLVFITHCTWQRTAFSPGIHGRLTPQYVLCFPKVIIRIYSLPPSVGRLEGSWWCMSHRVLFICQTLPDVGLSFIYWQIKPSKQPLLWPQPERSSALV